MILMMTDREQVIAQMLITPGYDIDHRTWLYKVGLRETHQICWIGRYGVMSYGCSFRT